MKRSRSSLRKKYPIEKVHGERIRSSWGNKQNRFTEKDIEVVAVDRSRINLWGKK